VGEQGSEKGATVSVEMTDTAFDPSEVTAKVGDTIEWENYDDFDHNVVADSGADFQSDDFGKGGTFEWTAAKPGEVTYECTIHPGMTGTITVEK
jgi:plastocyanin